MVYDKHLFPYEWYLKDNYPATNINKNGCNVFGTFISGGGSSMGYKLAGFNHLGGVEIDKTIAPIYKENHNPKYFYLQDLRDFNKRSDLPKELYNLDILDGSPPCSTFSLSGSREKAWGKQKKFREGQVEQTLDDLVFVYIETIKKLKPKVCILENVKGIISGNAKVYSKEIVKRLKEIGYNVQVFLLNAASMGVPQKRERVFFIGLRNDFKLPKLKLEFNETPITYKEIENIYNTQKDKQDTAKATLWYKVVKGNSFSKHHPKGHFFNDYKLDSNSIIPTITADKSHGVWNGNICRMLDKQELCLSGTFPLDYKFGKQAPKYLIGMSVPPVMIAQISLKIYEQWLSKINNGTSFNLYH